jgi:hypothetical protein
MRLGTYTLSVWVRPVTNNENWTGIAGRGTGSYRNYNFWLNASNSATSGSLHYKFKHGSTGSFGPDDTSGILMGSWTHIVGTNSGNPGYAKSFLNGELIQTKTLNDTIGQHQSSDFRIGANPDSGAGNYFKGRIQDLRLYSRALSESEVSDLFNAAASDSGAPVITSPSQIWVNAGVANSKTMSCTVPNPAFPATWSASGLPSGLQINPSTGLITGAPSATNDVVLADFEGGNYGSWTTTGTAFGSAPYTGTFAINGKIGSGAVQTYSSVAGGDGSQGTLTSPTFTINRNFLTVLVGGGNHPTSACFELLVGGSVVFSATGQNNHNLTPHSFDLSSYQGQTGQIRIRDEHSGGWGWTSCTRSCSQTTYLQQSRQATDMEVTTCPPPFPSSPCPPKSIIPE